jgi:lipopolysaccharide transport system permease protein
VQEKFGDWGRIIVAINPIVGVIDGFRWAICGTTQMHWQSFALSSALSLALLVLGVWYFRRTEKTFADVI